MNRITRRIISVLLSLALIFTGINLQADNAKADDADSIKISTAEQLALIGKDENYPLDGNYTLENDIDNVTFTIGQTENTYPDSFTGTFDGNGHAVTLNINAEKTYQGLFGTINGATVKNVVVKGSITSTRGYVAGITPKAVNSKIENCGADLTIKLTDITASNIGGITGYAENSTVSNCYSKGTISGKIKYCGGIIGQIQKNTNVSNCYNTAEISTTLASAQRVGGIVGYSNTTSTLSSDIKNCYNSGVVTGNGQVGSIYGFLTKTTNSSNIYYVENTHEKSYGFGNEVDVSGITMISTDELKTLAEKLGEAYVDDETNGYPILTWEANTNTDEEDTETLNELVKVLPSGVIRPKFNEVKNIVTYISNLINAKDEYRDKGIKVSIKSVSNRFDTDKTFVESDGTLHYYYKNMFENPGSNMNFENVDVVFNLTLNNVTVEYTPSCVQLRWDLDKVKDDLNTVASNYESEQILGENENLDAVVSNLQLPTYPTVKYNEKNTTCKWIKTTYTSSDTDVISIAKNADWDNDYNNMYYKASVYRQNEDTDVTITATFTFERFNDSTEASGVTETFTKEIKVKVLAYDEVKEESKKLDEKLNAYKDNMSDFTTGGALDFENVKGDVLLATPRKLDLDGKYYSFDVKSSDTSVMEVYGYRTYTYRPLPGEEAKEVTLNVTVSSKENPNIKATREIKLKVAPLTDKEIDDAITFMNNAKNNFFEFIKNNNADRDNITGDLKTFYGIYENEDGSVYSSTYVNKPNNNGIIVKIHNPEEPVPDNQRYWISSDKNIVDDETLRVTVPEYDTVVTVGALISHEVYENYAKRYADNEVYGPKFAQLANQTVTVDLKVKGEKGEVPTTTEAPTTVAPTTVEPATTENPITEKVTTIQPETVTATQPDTTGNNNIQTTKGNVKETTTDSGISKKKLTVKGLKTKKAKKKISIKWKKNTYSSGYVIKYRALSKSKKYKKIILKSNKKNKFTLKKKYKYRIKIRAYKIINNVKVYGKWKTITTK